MKKKGEAHMEEKPKVKAKRKWTVVLIFILILGTIAAILAINRPIHSKKIREKKKAEVQIDTSQFTADSLQGLTASVSNLEAVKGYHPDASLNQITHDTNVIKKLEADISKVDFDTPGTYDITYNVTCVVITWIELMTLYRGQGYLLAVIRNIAEKFPEYQLCLEYDRKREGDYEESIEKLCSIGFEKILSARSKPRRLSYNGERCIFSKNDHLKLCEFHLPKKKKLVYKIIVFTVTSSVKEMAWYYLDGNEMDLVKKLIDDGNDVKFYAGSQINKDNETTYEEYLKQEGVNITPNVRFDTLEKAMEIWNLLKPDRSWKDIAKKLPSYALSNEIGMESKNIYLVDLSTKNAYHTANDYLQHYYPNDFNPIDYFYNGEKIIIELNDDENRYYLYGDVDEYFEHARQALLKYIDPENVEMEDVHSQKVFAYECSDGDKGIITAESLKQASKLFKTDYPERKIASNDKEYWDNGAYLYEVEAVKKNTLYKIFTW